MSDLYSLITTEDVAAHLRLYGAIRSFLFVMGGEGLVEFHDDVLQPTRSGSLFLRRAIYRFKLWLTLVLRPKLDAKGPNQGVEDVELPPYDVVMLLHGLILHPRHFQESILRLYPELAVLKSFPLHQVAAHVRDDMEYVSTKDQVSHWEFVTGESFEPPLHTTKSDTFKIDCPGCGVSFEANWLTATSSGTLAVPCSTCNLVITDAVLNTAQLFKDIRRAMSQAGVGLSGTIFTREGNVDVEKSRSLTNEFAQAIDFNSLEKLPLDEAASRIDAHPISKDSSSKILPFYNFSGGFPLDIADAALRQTRFASKMYHNGWTNPQFAAKSTSILQESIKRYGQFLRISMDTKVGNMGPAHDIDLVWHTHQLLPNYRNDCIRLFGWFLDHVDLAESVVLATSYTNAGDIWKREYGSVYFEYFVDWSFPVKA